MQLQHISENQLSGSAQVSTLDPWEGDDWGGWEHKVPTLCQPQTLEGGATHVRDLLEQ